MCAPGTGLPSVSEMVPSTQHGCPEAPPAISPPISISGASWVKNGPKTVASVAFPYTSPLIGSDVPGLGEELNALLPFGFGEPHLAQEGVQVPGQRLHELPQTRVRRTRERLDDAG